jgi:8-oxo-dGTP diphosphatase
MSIDQHFVGKVALKAVIVAPTGKVLICRNHHDAHTWDLPGGTMNAGEHPRDALVREVKEEFGVTISIERVLAVDHFIKPATGQQVVVVICAATVPEELEHFSLDATEIAEARWIGAEALALMQLFPAYQKVLEAYFA